MKKRIVCALLALVLIVGLVPMSGFAAGNKISEGAITILKELEGYTTKCNASGYTGYGTLCTEAGTHGSHKTTELKADVALREKLVELDTAVNKFASSKGLALRQNQHDALVLFSFQNGTAWTTGTGDFQQAIATRATGNEFLNMICNWSQADDDDRRMIEANMYLNNIYSSVVPSRYIQVTYNANGGKLDTSKTTFFYDVSLSETRLASPTRSGFIFRGWYDGNNWISRLTSDCDGKTLTAYWQGKEDKPADAIAVSYQLNASQLASTKVYDGPEGKQTGAAVSGNMWFDQEYIDGKGVKWARFWYVDLYTYTNPQTHKVYKVEKYDYSKDAASCPKFWVKVGSFQGSNGASGGQIVNVTVTNTYVNSRSEASVYSAKNGSYNMGANLRIMGEPVNGEDGFLWGQVVDENNATKGWVALMYTNWSSVQNSTTSAPSGSVIAKALVTVNGYVNVRSDAGVDNRPVGALPKGTQVDIYEIKYINGQQWGRCGTGWFCLSYAEVNWITKDNAANDVGFTSYAFTGTLHQSAWVHVSPSDTAEQVTITDADRKNVVFTNITAGENGTWAKMSKGWVRITDTSFNPINATLDAAKFYVVADTATVRNAPKTEAGRVDTLVRGVEFKVTRIVADSTTVWGYADKVGEDNKTYGGWVNLASKYVSRNGAPVVDTTGDAPTGLIATVVGTDTVNVRAAGDIYSAKVGSMLNGATAAVLAGPTEDGWYKLDIDVDNNPETESWVYGKYLNVREGSVAGNGTTGGTAAAETGSGIIANTYGGVNVRQSPGVGGALLGKILPGTPVTILEVRNVGASKWGRVEQGWICMDYVAMISYDEIPGYNGGTPTTGGSTSTSETAIYTGTVKLNLSGPINVRKETDLDSDVVRTLNPGDPITLHEIVTVTEQVTETVQDENKGSTTTVVTVTSYWARINDGYVYNPGSHLDLNTVDQNTYTVTGAEKLNVRSVAGDTTEATVLFKLMKGEQVSVTKLQIVAGNVWGYVECDEIQDEDSATVDVYEGWACLSYMTKGAVATGNNDGSNTVTPPVTPPAAEQPSAPAAPVNGSLGDTGPSVGGAVKYNGKIINTNEVNVRATASTNAARTTTLKRGASIVIYETLISEGMAWGRCDAGWIYLYYVDMTPASGSAVDARVVYNEGTTIYTDSTGTTVAGSYARMAVIDIYEVVGKMARTNLGWVNTDNLL